MYWRATTTTDSGIGSAPFYEHSRHNFPPFGWIVLLLYGAIRYPEQFCGRLIAESLGKGTAFFSPDVVIKKSPFRFYHIKSIIFCQKKEGEKNSP